MTSPAAPSTPAPAPPTTITDRVTLLDALRGFALIGVLLMNMPAFSGIVYMSPDQMAASSTAATDLPVAVVMLWLAYGKFYSIFSLLFGIGFALQLDAALRRGDAHVSVFKRRLVVLLGIGLVHMYAWEGDILVLYALIGFMLLPLRRMPDPLLLRTSAVLLFAPVLLQLAITLSGGALDPGAPLVQLGERTLLATGFANDALPYPTLAHAGWAEYLRFQLSGPFFRYADLLTTGRPFKVLAMFLLGLWIGRSSLLRGGEETVPLLRRVQRWGFIVGAPAALAQAVLLIAGGAAASWLKLAEALAYALGVVPLALAYAATFTLLYHHERWRRRLDVLGPAGRMALTNYLSQTALQILLFYGVGFALMGKVGATLLPLITATVITAQVLGSRWWLSRFQFGPMEWIWRQATYGRRLPLRSTSSPEASA